MKNCFSYSSNLRYYLTHPWEFFEDTWLNIKAGWQRATRGWADRDTWSLDHYLLEILPEMIDYLRENTHGYPGEYNGFPTPESWNTYLKEEIIIPLQNAREDQAIQINEYEEELQSYPMIFIKEERGYTSIQRTKPDELCKKWLAREKEIRGWQQKELERALTSMAKYFYHLWD